MTPIKRIHSDAHNPRGGGPRPGRAPAHDQPGLLEGPGPAGLRVALSEAQHREDGLLFVAGPKTAKARERGRNRGGSPWQRRRPDSRLRRGSRPSAKEDGHLTAEVPRQWTAG